jgi:F5/8 type C domain-containing protein
LGFIKHALSTGAVCLDTSVSGILNRGGFNMRKRQIISTSQDAASDEEWMDIGRAASVEITSEENGYPIESALLGEGTQGWRASESGPQTIRLNFDEPQKLKSIWLVFEDHQSQRTQEFVLRWSPDGGRSFREIVRQQWNFSQPDAVREIERYAVELSDVTMLELNISPDKSGGKARASLAKLRMA